jgi:hypothetical protein
MENVASSEKYLEERKQFEEEFNKYVLIGEVRDHTSPSGNYQISISSYETKAGCWNATKGVVSNTDGEELFTIFRNYHSFLWSWVEHDNGNEYLLCGEDYQGYVILNLTQKIKHTYFPKSALDGVGFCWIYIEDYNKESDKKLSVDGCYWGCPYETVIYDFSDPDMVPLPELDRYDATNEDEGDE